ncbi:efflux RND transporter periplasmic adaptor subunit [Comamonas sp. B21-038]|uniref:efflux RND transporter periplasmic adaptor subunit n=1 Tax=Comamonas sp. B21-038 TaxID=2918299 RepID=UPI001EFACE72|nr:efflux RND transporter periplasmic adaptor subunit [Comamonas sp. B21-038]ULR88250.1 efflux RND transporter periplasmic adaptor subunit [Comamonas sp. B21-038]
MSEKTRFDSSLTSSKQWIAAALIAAAGVAGGAYLLRGPGSAAAAPASGHADAPSHKDGEHHGEAAAKTGAKAGAQADAHQEADQHGDGEHHDEKAEAGSKDAHGAAEGGHAEGEEAGEGLVKLSPAQAKAAGLVVAQAGPASIKKQVLLPGEIRFDEDRTAHVVPRVAGVVASVHAQLGEQVAKGQLLAVIQSPAVSDQRSELQTAQRRLAFAKRNYEREKQLWQERISAEQDYQAAQQALQEAEIAVANAAQKLSAIGAGAGAGTGGSSRYELRAPLAGMVVEKHLTVGESVTDSTASFTVSDLRSVWAEISVAAPQLPDVRMGAPVVVRATAFDSQAEGRIAYVGALIGAQTRTAPARVALANPQGVWRPGLFVDVELLAGESPVPIAVDAKAIQRPDGKESVVFVPTEGGYQAQVVQLGATDGKTTEVTSGLNAGQSYVKQGSFMLRAELGKASAEHAH